MQDQAARLDNDQLRDAVSQIKMMTQNCAEAIHITLTAVTTASPDESLRPVFLKETMGIFKTQKGLMDGQQENSDKLGRLAEDYIAEHAGVAGGF